MFSRAKFKLIGTEIVQATIFSFNDTIAVQ
jgi:hypothetical protein